MSSVLENPTASSSSAMPRADTGTLGKAMTVLEIIATAKTPMRFTDVLNATDQPRGTLHRQISNLVEEGLIQVNPDHSYTAGVRLLKFAARAWSHNSLRSVAMPHIETLHASTGETVHLGQISELEVIYLDKIESNQTVRMHSQVGNASPLYCTGIGKAMMARLPLDDAKTRAAQFAYHRYTPTTIKSAREMMRELTTIRETGVAHDREEHEIGITCVAASIITPDPHIVGGISVTAPTYRIKPDTLEEWAHLVRATAKAIETDLIEKLGPRN